MQSDRNTFCGDVVLDSVNMAFRDEDNFLDQIPMVRSDCITMNTNINKVMLKYTLMKRMT